MLDLFDLIGIIGRWALMLGAALVVGWLLHVPGAYELVQHVLDSRRNQAIDIFVNR